MESHKEDILEYQEYILNPKDNILVLKHLEKFFSQKKDIYTQQEIDLQ